MSMRAKNVILLLLFVFYLINAIAANKTFTIYHEKVFFLSYFSTGKSQKNSWLSCLNRNLQNKENEKSNLNLFFRLYKIKRRGDTKLTPGLQNAFVLFVRNLFHQILKSLETHCRKVYCVGSSGRWDASTQAQAAARCPLPVCQPGQADERSSRPQQPSTDPCPPSPTTPMPLQPGSSCMVWVGFREVPNTMPLPHGNRGSRAKGRMPGDFCPPHKPPQVSGFELTPSLELQSQLNFHVGLQM